MCEFCSTKTELPWGGAILPPWTPRGRVGPSSPLRSQKGDLVKKTPPFSGSTLTLEDAVNGHSERGPCCPLTPPSLERPT